MIDIQYMLAATFEPMTQIPFLKESLAGVDGGATAMFNALFKLSVTLGAMLAVFMFIWGGLQMIMARDSAGSVGEGRKKMSNAVIGLLMLISTFVVLNTINPQLTSLAIFKDVNGEDLSRLEAPQRNTGMNDRAINDERSARRSTQTRMATSPKRDGATNNGTYCYQDIGYSDEYICFETMNLCTSNTIGTRAQGNCKSLTLSPQDKDRLITLERDRSLSVKCIAPRSRRGRCDPNEGYYNTCPEGVSCKTITVEQSTIVKDGRYETGNIRYNNKEYCELQAKKNSSNCIQVN